MTRRAARAGIVGLLAAALGAGLAGPAHAADDGVTPPDDADAVGSPLTEAPAAADTVDVGTYPGDPVAEAELVAREDRRLVDIALVASGVLYPDLDVTRPFRVAGNPTSTLVLPARDAAYTEEDLVALAPLTFVETAPGVFLLSESIVVGEGATLDLRRPGGMRIALASQDNGFTSIVVAGGNLVVKGTTTEHIVFEAWDAQRSEPDLDTSDGRSYVRVMGGYASITDATFLNLGFWSGNTGGLALTGTQTASTLGLGDGAGEIPEVYLETPGDVAAPVGGTDDGLVVDGTADTGIALTRGSGLYSTGVTAWLSGLTVTGNAFGVFVSDASSVELQSSTVTQSLVDGVVFHREVTSSRITGVESSANAGDGFRVSRGSDTTILDTLVATGNGGNGITIDSTPLADGPSATGLPATPYGGHSLVNGRFTGNAQYGIAVLGGSGISVRRNTVEGSRFGVLVGEGAREVLVQENRIEGSAEQGIALRDQSEADVWGNEVLSTVIGIYARDSAVVVERNTVEEVTSHGITFVGDSTGSRVSRNLIAGMGSSPVDTYRATGVTVDDTNEWPEWAYENLWSRVLHSLTKPLTVLWLVLAVLLLFTAFRGFRFKGSGFGSPYDDRRPLTELSAGLADPSSVPGVALPRGVDGAASPSAAGAPDPSPGSPPLPHRSPQSEPVTV